MVKPISFREPRFSTFGPGRLDRKWTGYSAPMCGEVKIQVELKDAQGSPLSEEEIEELVEKYGHDNCNSQINLELESKNSWTPIVKFMKLKVDGTYKKVNYAHRDK
ncbi:hypothetical protein AMTR_s00062p00145540 [Amborella trichopoda]|uniref:Uncharacterized protein n=1 Tax=Amborella trichopoda TaxID=13333 RepID=U5DDY8_AMBTC|nr:hypothetical protein AMTR_s00062p00145540 [Amborella trichopoda]